MTFFDSNTVADTDYEPIAAGSYPLLICKAEMKPTRKGDGRYCNVELQIASGSNKGRKIFDMFNLENPSEKAANIGRAMFKKLVCAAGVPVIQTEDHLATLVDRVVVGEVVIETGSDGEKRNKVKRYFAYTSGSSMPAYSAPMSPPENDPLSNIPF